MKEPIGINDRTGRNICDGDTLRLGTDLHFKDVIVKREVLKREICYGQGSYGTETFVGYYFDGYYGSPEEGIIVDNGVGLDNTGHL